MMQDLGQDEGKKKTYACKKKKSFRQIWKIQTNNCLHTVHRRYLKMSTTEMLTLKNEM